MKKLIQIIMILVEDKRKGQDDRSERVTAINALLGVTRIHTTEDFNTENHTWYVEYNRPQFWYDFRPITLSETIRLFKSWHVRLWRCIGQSKSAVAFTNTMVHGFGKRAIYEFLHAEAKNKGVMLDQAEARRKTETAKTEEE